MTHDERQTTDDGQRQVYDICSPQVICDLDHLKPKALLGVFLEGWVIIRRSLKTDSDLVIPKHKRSCLCYFNLKSVGSSPSDE